MIDFRSLQAIIDLAEAEGKPISALVLQQTALDMEISEDEVLARMHGNLAVMREAVAQGAEQDVKSVSGLTGGMAYKVKARALAGESLPGALLAEIIYSALAVSELNACMGKIVAAPTAGSCGILPACLLALQNRRGLSDDAVVSGLLTASAVGMVIARNATLAGAEGGCQAECGSAAAMAAAGMVELAGGTPAMCGHAAAQVLKSLMGLVCDPVAGLVEEPCIIRNPSSAGIALVAAELSLAGIESLIPVDEVITTMGQVGKQLPESLRETAEGGVAICKTGRRLAAEVAARAAQQ